MLILLMLMTRVVVWRLMTDPGWTQCWWVSRYRDQLPHQMVASHQGGGGQYVIETKKLSRM